MYLAFLLVYCEGGPYPPLRHRQFEGDPKQNQDLNADQSEQNETPKQLKIACVCLKLNSTE